MRHVTLIILAGILPFSSWAAPVNGPSGLEAQEGQQDPSLSGAHLVHRKFGTTQAHPSHHSPQFNPHAQQFEPPVDPMPHSYLQRRSKLNAGAQAFQPQLTHPHTQGIQPPPALNPPPQAIQPPQPAQPFVQPPPPPIELGKIYRAAPEKFRDPDDTSKSLKSEKPGTKHLVHPFVPKQMHPNGIVEGYYTTHAPLDDNVVEGNDYGPFEDKTNRDGSISTTKISRKPVFVHDSDVRRRPYGPQPPLFPGKLDELNRLCSRGMGQACMRPSKNKGTKKPSTPLRANPSTRNKSQVNKASSPLAKPGKGMKTGGSGTKKPVTDKAKGRSPAIRVAGKGQPALKGKDRSMGAKSAKGGVPGKKAPGIMKNSKGGSKPKGSVKTTKPVKQIVKGGKPVASRITGKKPPAASGSSGVKSALKGTKPTQKKASTGKGVPVQRKPLKGVTKPAPGIKSTSKGTNPTQKKASSGKGVLAKGTPSRGVNKPAPKAVKPASRVTKPIAQKVTKPAPKMVKKPAPKVAAKPAAKVAAKVPPKVATKSAPPKAAKPPQAKGPVAKKPVVGRVGKGRK